MKKIVLLICLFLIGGCGNSSQNSVDNSTPDYEQLMAENEYIIIDVRTEEEFKSGHLTEAINIPHDTIDEDLDLDKEKLIFVYCQSGNRSSQAKSKLKNLGYEVYDLGAYDSIDLPKE